MNRSRIRNTAVAIFACASVAAVVGIATGAAAPSNNSHSSNGSRIFFRGPPGVSAFAEGGPAPAFGGPPVHSEMVVPNKAGDGFITVTGDDGKVNSVAGNQLTITEGTAKATYKTVTLDIPSDATVIRDGNKSTLGDLQSGDQVHVSQSPDGSFVFATDSAFQQKMLKQMREHFKGLPKPPSGLPGGPPPGPSPEPMAGRGY